MPLKLRKMDFNKVCRSCLSEKGHLREIHTTKIPTMMESISSIQVSENDELPRNVCVTCFHLIAKFYTFKKRLERSDKFLQSYIKNNRSKQNDIINIALSEAEITGEKETEEFDISDTELSKDDMPLSERLSKPKKIKAVEKNLEGIKFDINLEQLGLSITNTKEDQSENTKKNISNQIFTDGPPPLIPLVLKLELKNETTDSAPTISLPKNTPPPLIPIKPLDNLESVIENIIEEPNLKFTCNSCQQEFKSLVALKEHKLTTCQTKPLECNICKKEFKERKKLIGHLRGHMVAKDYGCKICGKRYPNPSTFKVHMRTHTGERPFKCQVCNKGFVRWAGVVGHMKTHESVKPFKCESCGKCFKIASNLERHKVLHSGILPYCCSYCGKTFSQSDNLQLHIRTYHTNERPYLCSECGKGFVSSTRLNRHMWVHTGYKPYTCRVCPKAYSNSNDLKNHERSHTLGGKNDAEKQYACTHCYMRFYHPCRLQRHLKTHEKPYTCDICSKSFTRTTFLNKHVEKRHKIMYIQETILQPDGVSQIYVQYQQ